MSPCRWRPAQVIWSLCCFLVCSFGKMGLRATSWLGEGTVEAKGTSSPYTCDGPTGNLEVKG